MKKFYKICLITVAVMLLLSFIILGACTIIKSNGWYEEDDIDITLPDYVSLPGITSSDLHHSNISGHIEIDEDDHFSCSFSSSHPTYVGEHQNAQAALGSDITKLNFLIGYGKCIISESSDEYVHISANTEHNFQYYTENGTFYLKGFETNSKHVKFKNYDRNVIYLELPKDLFIKKAELVLGAGEMQIAGLDCDSFEVSVGAGEFTVDSLNCDSLSASVGAGNLSLKHAVTREADFETGLGNISYTGTISGDMNTEVGMGSASFRLNGRQKSHNYDLTGGMGNITVGESHYGGIAFEEYVHNEADSTYTLSCAMGNISVAYDD